MKLLSAALRLATVLSVAGLSSAPAQIPSAAWHAIPQPGFASLQIAAPAVLELERIERKEPSPARFPRWNYVGDDGVLSAPKPGQFSVRAGGRDLAVDSVGFKRRIAYAPLKVRDLRVRSSLILKLAAPVRDGETVEILFEELPGSPPVSFRAEADPNRPSRAIHVSQAGYQQSWPKLAMVGYYLGSAGELSLEADTSFEIVDEANGRVAFAGKLRPRREEGFPYSAYQQVGEADFSALDRAGSYRLRVPGLGSSQPFLIHEGLGAALARTTALGLYHLRCGAPNALPWSRFHHAACHLAPAQVPVSPAPPAENAQDPFAFTWTTIANYAKQPSPDVPPQRAPPLSSPDSQLYPLQRRGGVDVSGGHHDAGDYSKYTINSAALIHSLIFAVDAFPGVALLDNLGLPESGDRIGDVLQIAKWEADFLAKLQDGDGGFSFLVYPQSREYENNVLPDAGDPQVIWPKNTAATAAAVAALAQAASSAPFKKHFPAAAREYLARARAGWDFLEKAIARHGLDGSYQKMTHYGDVFTHRDELAWAATEIFLATGDAGARARIAEWLHPSSPDERRWSWWRLWEGYGNATRSYAFAARSGRVAVADLDARLLAECEKEIAAAGQDQLRWSDQSAYGTSFPDHTKRFRSGAWYYSTDAAFELVAALLLEPEKSPLRARLFNSLLTNFNYTTGANPADVSYLTGLGWNRPQEIVSQYAVNDRRQLPPAGILLSNVQAGYSWMEAYGTELRSTGFPADDNAEAPYPLYDRWGDVYNVTTESTIANQGRALAAAAWLMAQTPLHSQPWAPRSDHPSLNVVRKGDGIGLAISGRGAPSLSEPGVMILWEASGMPPTAGAGWSPVGPPAPDFWLEAEVQWADGRRLHAVTDRLP